MTVKSDIEIAREAQDEADRGGRRQDRHSRRRACCTTARPRPRSRSTSSKSLSGQEGRQADPGHRDQPDAGGRRQDDDDGRPRRRPQPHRQARDELPARALARAVLRRQGRCGRRRLLPRSCRWRTSTSTSPATSTRSPSAHNLLSAMIDNHIYWGNALGLDERRIAWRRVMDMNDRALRSIVELARRRRQRLSARGRLRHHGRLRGDGDLLPRHAT